MQQLETVSENRYCTGPFWHACRSFWSSGYFLTELTRVARENILVRWQEDIAELARYPNVYIKMSGLFMPILSHQFHKQDRLASKQEIYDLAMYCGTLAITGSYLPSTFPLSTSLLNIIDAFSDVVVGSMILMH
jgi:hypothetical protein